METGFSRCKCDFDSVARTPDERMVTDHPGSSWQLQLAWTGSYFERLGRFRYPADGRVSEIRRCVDQSGSAGGRSRSRRTDLLRKEADLTTTNHQPRAARAAHLCAFHLTFRSGEKRKEIKEKSVSSMTTGVFLRGGKRGRVRATTL